VPPDGHNPDALLRGGLERLDLLRGVSRPQVLDLPRSETGRVHDLDRSRARGRFTVRTYATRAP